MKYRKSLPCNVITAAMIPYKTNIAPPIKIAPMTRNGTIKPTINKGDADEPEVSFAKGNVRKVEKKEIM